MLYLCVSKQKGSIHYNIMRLLKKLCLLAVLVCCVLPAFAEVVVIKTNVGTMKIKLHDDVPRHKEYFLKLVRDGYFDQTLFYRTISYFIVQGGAQDSKAAPPGMKVGYFDRSMEIPSEMKPHYFPKKGALAAPRHGDDVNPEKRSDMSQFFIVSGRVYPEAEITNMEREKNNPIKRKAMDRFYKPVKAEMDSLKLANPEEYNKRVVEINAKVDSVLRATPGHLLFTPEEKEAYTTVGGCHYLTDDYTIFGQLIEGYDVLDIIANQETDLNDRPKKDIRMLKVYVEQ